MNNKNAVWIFLVATLAVLPSTWLSAYVANQIWEWFMVPAGLKSVGLLPFMGLALLTNLHRSVRSKEDRKSMMEEPWYHISAGFTTPLALWGIGWVVWRVFA